MNIINSGENQENKKKRGRKKKTEESVLNTPPIIPILIPTENNNNIHITIQETTNPEIIEPVQPLTEDTIENHLSIESTPSTTEDCVLSKKRGRKPKGGKIITKQPEKNVNLNTIANIILHLRCSLNDLNEYNYKINKLMSNPLEYDPSIPPVISTYNDRDHSKFFIYNQNDLNHTKPDNNPQANEINLPNVLKENNILNTNSAYQETIAKSNNELSKNYCSKCNEIICQEDAESTRDNAELKEDKSGNMKEINSKLKKLKIQLYKNQLQDKKSACFWCTYDYDNPSCYIPKYEADGTIFGYGSFCRPECAVAYLMKESIDDSMKFERYHLLNQIYSKVYDYKKNIKPAPNPYYLLEKYYGNLSIQEYRKLLKTEHLLLVIEKPMTRILPELHEDNENMVMNLYGGSGKVLNAIDTNTSGVYKVKRQSEKPQGPSKSSIIKDKFGISQ
jgi:hypothetical protein